MRLHICSKSYYNYYIIHPLSEALTRKERVQALIYSIAFGIFTLGIGTLVCAIRYQYINFQLRRAMSECAAEINTRFMEGLNAADFKNIFDDNVGQHLINIKS
jgi:hypothetical protein